MLLLANDNDSNIVSYFVLKATFRDFETSMCVLLHESFQAQLSDVGFAKEGPTPR